MAEPADATLRATVTEADLEGWGRRVGAAAAAGEIATPLVVLLCGPLGAGKSVLARAIARGAGVHQPMPSPTYNLLFSYTPDPAPAGPRGSPLTVHHLDLYRLEHPDDVWELGWQELGEGHEIVLIEWPERVEELLPPDGWDVRLGPTGEPASAELRVFRVTPRGDGPPPPPLPEGVDR